jgi:hypothetical protein
MPVVHSREELEAVTASLSERAFADGVLWDVPKARRREQAKNPQKQLRIGLEGDLKVRMATQINRFVEKYGKQLGWDVMIRRLEREFETEDEQ